MSYSLIAEHFPVARKMHRCIWCGESIVTGEKYRDERSTFDGEFQHHKWHMECNADAVEYFNSGEGPEFYAHENERPKSIPKEPNK